MKSLVATFALALAALCVLPPTDAWTLDHGLRSLATNSGGVQQIGTDQPANISALVGVTREDTLSYAGASYIAVKFESFNLPPGDEVTVKSPDSSVSFTYTGKGRANAGDFYSSRIPGDKAIVQYTARAAQAPVSSTGGYAYKIPMFARGFSGRTIQQYACGVDDTVPAKCYASGTELSKTLPLAYERAQAVALLVMNGKGACTGWLVGSEGHLMTNNHCIGSQAEAGVTDFEFEVESFSCEEQCLVNGGCGGSELVATTSTLVATESKYDYALVKLPDTASIKKYGYLQLRHNGPVNHEPVYLPQHPKAYPKRISAVYGGKDATIVGATSPSYLVSFNADVDPGTSGSPLLAKSDNAVVTLVNSAGCTPTSDGTTNGANYGHNVREIIADLDRKGVTVKDMIASGPSNSRTPAPTPAPSKYAGECWGPTVVTCENTFFCTWNILKKSCQRWW